jgi:hypothetical protein
MAPVFKHGKGAKILMNTAALSTVLNEVSFDGSAETADVTCFGDNDRNYIAGMRTASGSFTGLHDGSTAETDRLFQSALGGATADVFTIGVAGDAAGSHAYLAAGVLTQYSVSAPASDVVAASAAVQFTSESRGGVWVLPLAARAQTTGSAAVALAGSSASTRGGVAHLHVTGGTTSASTANEIRVRVQDSSNGTAWADLITFTAISSTAPSAVQRSTVAGTVYDNVRAASTGGSTSITYAVAFARN